MKDFEAVLLFPMLVGCLIIITIILVVYSWKLLLAVIIGCTICWGLGFGALYLEMISEGYYKKWAKRSKK